MYYLTVFVGQESRHRCWVLCSGSHRSKINVSAGLLPHMAPGVLSKAIQVVGRIQILVAVGLKSCFLE